MPAPTELVAVFREAIREWPEAAPRTMFGYPCAFARGQMFFLLHHEDFALRLAAADRADLIAAHDAAPFAPMREYVVVPPALVRSPEALNPWIAKALAYVQALPPKVAKPRKSKAAR